MTLLKRILAGAVILVVIPLLLAILLSKSSRKDQGQELPNGLYLNIEQVTHGNLHKYGPPEIPFAILKQIIPSLPVDRSINQGSADDSLVVWLSLENKKKEWILPLTNVVSVVARDKIGSRFTSQNILTLDEKHWRYQSNWGSSNITPPPSSKWFISLVTLEQYPRNESSFELDLLDVHKNVITTLEIHNPVKTTPKNWKPESFPIIKKTEAVDIQLTTFTNSWRIRRAGYTQSELPQYIAHWKFDVIGGSSNAWTADRGTIEDTYGNISNIGSHQEGNLSMEAEAWKLTYDFHQKTTADFPPENVWDVTLEMPGKGKSKALNLSKNMMGVLIEVKSITGPKTKVSFKDGIPQKSSLNENASGMRSSSSSTFNGKSWVYTTTIDTSQALIGFRFPRKQDKYRISCLMKTKEGNFKPLFARQNSGLDHLMGTHEKMPDAPMELRIIIQPVFQQSFFIEPRLDPPNHKFTRAKKISERNQSLPKELINLSSYYTKGFNSAISLMGRIGTSSIGTSFTLKPITPSTHTLDDIKWDLRGMIVLTGKCHSYQYLEYPESISEIPINQKVRKLHFLHGCLWPIKHGTQIGSYRIQFENGQSKKIPLLYGVNIANVLQNNQLDIPIIEEANKIEIKSASRNNRPITQQYFYHFEWLNPFPDQQIIAMEFESTRKMPAPILLGLTVEP